jgi:hypothetical protein
VLPRRSRKGNYSFYDEIIREFLYSGVKYARVKDIGKKPMTVLVGIKNRVRQRKDNINVVIRNKRVYLERLDSIHKSNFVPKTNTYSNADCSAKRKVSFDVMKLLNTTIVKARCPRCRTLNTKDSRTCRDCGHPLYQTEQDYQAAKKEMQSLEKTLNFLK